MVINKYQPIEELLQIVETKFFDDLEMILNAIPDLEKKLPVRANTEILGYIHHSLNIDRYKDEKFRKKLFVRIPQNDQKKYFKTCNVELISSYDEKVKQSIEFEWGSNTQTKNFIDFFQYPSYLLPIEEDEKKVQPYTMLFDFQAKVVFDTLKKIELSLSRALIQMPTGTGKTRTAMDIIVRLLNQSEEPLQIIWFANRQELLDQAYDAFTHVWTHAGKGEIDIVKFWGNEPTPEITKEKCVLFIGYAKFNYFKGQLNPNYIICDEAHQILATFYNETVESLVDSGIGTRLIGLTATPGRGISKIQNEKLIKKFRDCLVPLEIFNEEERELYEGNVVKYLEDQNILAKANSVKLHTAFEYELSEEEWKSLKILYEGDHPEWSSKFLEKLANDNIRNTIIVEELKKYAEEGKKILYFSVNKYQAQLVSVALQKIGISSVYVDDSTDKIFRKQIIKKFKDTDEISVICNFNIFAVGFDVPDLDVVFIGRPVNSPVLFNQMVGRGTRGTKMGAKNDSFILVQVMDKIKSKFMDFDPYEQYRFWDEYWKDE